VLLCSLFWPWRHIYNVMIMEPSLPQVVLRCAVVLPVPAMASPLQCLCRYDAIVHAGESQDIGCGRLCDSAFFTEHATAVLTMDEELTG
jgi:hypothetical protein